MSMPMLVSEIEEATPIAPMLRLADDVVDDGNAAGPSPATPGLRIVDGLLIADDAAVLPAACVVCGDTVGLRALVTPRGQIGFSLCREHQLSALARAAAGVAVLFIAAGTLAIDSGTASKLVLCFGFAALGVGLIASAVPIWTWQAKDGPRRLFRAHRDVVATVGRASR